MSFYEFKAPPQTVQVMRPPGPTKLPKYRNLMFEKKVVTGLTAKALADIDLKTKTLGASAAEPTAKLKGTKKTAPLSLNTAHTNTTDPLVLTPRAGEGHEDRGTLTEELFEDLSTFFPTINQSCQTDSLLSRTLRDHNIITPKGDSVGTQVERTDYLIDFDFQIQSVTRVLLNKVLEEGRMEVLEELEMQKIAQQKSRAHQDKLRNLSRLQRAQFKEDRIAAEVAQRRLQSQLSRQNSEAAYKKLCVRGLTKRLVAKAQAETERHLTDVREYLEVSTCRLFTDFLPLLEGQVMEELEAKLQLNSMSQRLGRESMDFLTRYHTEASREGASGL